MIQSVFACLNGKASHKKAARVAPLKETEAVVYRDELTESKKQTLRKALVKKRVRFADSEPTILGEDCNEKSSVEKSCDGKNDEFRENAGFRVKLRMTKEEAAQFLARCNGGILDLKDVARELGAMPLNRVSVVSTC
uniref:DUF7890 domain-containing protein n=1 Tax=Lotus japonicus TaxID=34305 RepID=I3SSL8_LOTJA|nr:unknown [Lotus japonicus]